MTSSNTKNLLCQPRAVNRGKMKVFSETETKIMMQMENAPDGAKVWSYQFYIINMYINSFKFSGSCYSLVRKKKGLE